MVASFPPIFFSSPARAIIEEARRKTPTMRAIKKPRYLLMVFHLLLRILCCSLPSGSLLEYFNGLPLLKNISYL
jgi:hypothetical protein